MWIPSVSYPAQLAFQSLEKGKINGEKKKNSREDWKKEKREEGKLIAQMSRLTRPVARIFCAGCVP